MQDKISKIMFLSASAVYIIRILNVISLKNETKITKATNEEKTLTLKKDSNKPNCENIKRNINRTKAFNVTPKKRYYIAKNIIAKESSENGKKRYYKITKYNPYKQMFTPDVFINAANYLQKNNKKYQMIKPNNKPTVSAQLC